VQDLSGVLVDGGHLVGCGGGGVDPVQRGDDQDAVHAGQAADDAHHPASADVGFDDLAVAEVGDEQQAAAGVEAFVVEAGAGAGQGELTGLAQGQGLARVAGP
jgi:hypothetical protein